MRPLRTYEYEPVDSHVLRNTNESSLLTTVSYALRRLQKSKFVNGFHRWFKKVSTSSEEIRSIKDEVRVKQRNGKSITQYYIWHSITYYTVLHITQTPGITLTNINLNLSVNLLEPRCVHKTWKYQKQCENENI